VSYKFSIQLGIICTQGSTKEEEEEEEEEEV
jgi:hypothetical protein